MLFRVCSAVFVALLASATYLVPLQLQPPEGTETWLFFDGVCNLCDGFVNFVYMTDSRKQVRFGALQKHKELLESFGAGRYAEGGAEAMSTVVVVQGKEVYVRSTAALRVLAVLSQPWRAFAVLSLLPTPIRDAGYKLVAEYRYLIFGRKDTCMSPSGDFKKRFLEYDPSADGDPDAPSFMKA
mmetsp:Transcript_88004/g.152470  ORF Transcript_88004/g.152470 Transcript_88004/m.152470 type:complete len:183 (-) Transcript_88004:71-619(-)